MVYRAKCTKIYSDVEDIYNTNKNHIVKDQSDYYIEVETENEAEIIEKMNKLQKEFSELKLKLIGLQLLPLLIK